MPRVRKVNRDVTVNRYPKRPGSVVETDLGEFVAEAKPEGKPRPKPKREMLKLLAEVDALRKRQAWSEMTPKHFVGLYCSLHYRVYGVYPDEVRAQWRQAVGAAMRMHKHEFGGDCARMIGFVRWVWNREKGRNEKRTAGDDFRIGWRLQFGPKLMVDYRVWLNRRGRRV